MVFVTLWFICAIYDTLYYTLSVPFKRQIVKLVNCMEWTTVCNISTVQILSSAVTINYAAASRDASSSLLRTSAVYSPESILTSPRTVQFPRARIFPISLFLYSCGTSQPALSLVSRPVRIRRVALDISASFLSLRTHQTKYTSMYLTWNVKTFSTALILTVNYSLM